MDKNYDYDNEIRTPSGDEFDPIVLSSIRRRYCYTIKDGKMTAATQYTVGGMCYKVNSIFDLLDTPKSEEGLKRQMVQEIDKVS